MTVITPCRPAEPHEIPKTAKALADVATANGWDVEVTYARHRNENTKPPREIDSIAVRMWRETRLAGIWYEGKFESGLVPSRRVSAATLKSLVQMDRAELAEYAREVAA